MSDAPPSVTQNGATQVEEAPGHKVFTGNLAYSTNESGLKELFQPFASDVVSVQVIHRGSRSAGYGFVAFSSLEAAEKAVTALNKKEFEGRTIIVEIAKPTEQKDKDRSQKRTKRRVGRRGAKAPPGEVTEAEANGDSDKPEGAAAPADTTESTKPRKRRFFRRNTRKGTKDSATGDDAPATSPTNNGEDAGPRKAPRQPRRRPTRASGEPPVGEPSTSVLFVANLGFDVDDEGLSTIFTSNGINVISAHVVKRRWGKPRKSKGYGFVDVGSEEEQKKAMAALQGKEFNGREVAVKIAVNAQDKEDDKEDDKEGEKVEKVENGDATA